MKKTKMQKGITLIALIITIIVLLIIAVVTIGSVRNSGIIGRSEEAKFKTEVGQIQEQLNLKKMEKMLDNIQQGVEGYNITIDTLDITDGLKSKYRDKLYISSEGILYYQEENVTDQEIQWLQDLEIGGYVAPTLFSIAKNVFDNQEEYDIAEIETVIKDEYPDAITYGYGKILGVIFPDEIAVNTTHSLVAFNGNERIHITEDGVVNYDISKNSDKIMTQEEAEKVFSTEINNQDEIAATLTLNRYIGTEANVIIPDLILGNNGQTIHVSKIVTGSFLPALQKVALADFMGQMLGWELGEGQTYADIYASKSPAELYELISGTKYEGDLTEEATISEKNNLMQQTIINEFGVSAEDVPIENDVLYIHALGAAIVPKDAGGTDISSIYIPATVQYIEENAFLYQTTLETVNWRYNNAMQSISSSAFAGCSNATINISNRTEEQFNSISGKPWGAKEAVWAGE